MKTVKFYTLGCKANQYDTQSIREGFQRLGFIEPPDKRRAGICLINTCTVTQKADSDSLNIIRRAQRDNPGSKVIVTGCLAELDREKIRRECARSLIIRNKDKGKILAWLFKDSAKYRLKGTGFKANGGISGFKGHSRAFLKIQDGCNNFCSYCKVPLVRGRSESRAVKEIVKEAEALAKNGFKEIVLTGICLGAYGRDLKLKPTLVELIENLEKIEGLSRIRLSSIEALDISDELIKKISGSKKLCRHLHIPLQSADDAVLKRMNRKYSRIFYLTLVKKIKKHIPGAAITTDCLVGFPGEREESFANTLEAIKEIGPLRVHIFPYSKRKGTAAYQFKDEVSPLVIKKRIARLKEVAEACAGTYKKMFLNKTADVLIEENLRQDPVCWQGYTDNYIRVMVRSRKSLKNRIMTLKLKKISKGLILAEQVRNKKE